MKRKHQPNLGNFMVSTTKPEIAVVASASNSSLIPDEEAISQQSIVSNYFAFFSSRMATLIFQQFLIAKENIVLTAGNHHQLLYGLTIPNDTTGQQQARQFYNNHFGSHLCSGSLLKQNHLTFIVQERIDILLQKSFPFVIYDKNCNVRAILFHMDSSSNAVLAAVYVRISALATTATTVTTATTTATTTTAAATTTATTTDATDATDTTDTSAPAPKVGDVIWYSIHSFKDLHRAIYSSTVDYTENADYLKELYYSYNDAKSYVSFYSFFHEVSEEFLNWEHYPERLKSYEVFFIEFFETTLKKDFSNYWSTVFPNIYKTPYHPNGSSINSKWKLSLSKEFIKATKVAKIILNDIQSIGIQPIESASLDRIKTLYFIYSMKPSQCPIVIQTIDYAGRPVTFLHELTLKYPYVLLETAAVRPNPITTVDVVADIANVDLAADLAADLTADLTAANVVAADLTAVVAADLTAAVVAADLTADLAADTVQSMEIEPITEATVVADSVVADCVGVALDCVVGVAPESMETDAKSTPAEVIRVTSTSYLLLEPGKSFETFLKEQLENILAAPYLRWHSMWSANQNGYILIDFLILELLSMPFFCNSIFYYYWSDIVPSGPSQTRGLPKFVYQSRKHATLPLKFARQLFFKIAQFDITNNDTWTIMLFKQLRMILINRWPTILENILFKHFIISANDQMNLFKLEPINMNAKIFASYPNYEIATKYEDKRPLVPSTADMYSFRKFPIIEYVVEHFIYIKAYLIPLTAEVIILPSSRIHVTSQNLIGLTTEWLYTFGIIAEAVLPESTKSELETKVLIFVKPLRCLSMAFATLLVTNGKPNSDYDWFYSATKDFVIP